MFCFHAIPTYWAWLPKLGNAVSINLYIIPIYLAYLWPSLETQNLGIFALSPSLGCVHATARKRGIHALLRDSHLLCMTPTKLGAAGSIHFCGIPAFRACLCQSLETQDLCIFTLFLLPGLSLAKLRNAGSMHLHYSWHRHRRLLCVRQCPREFIRRFVEQSHVCNCATRREGYVSH